ncbi:MAG: DUF4258 domain-containing protein [Deltaproteobacteria bacterium]|nr:DUF4258 domain-containing protein [Deltaproteobacteria bacterium]
MIEDIKEKVEIGDYRLTVHAFERCVERNISPGELKDVILSGEILENYSKDKYSPSCLIFGKTEEGRVLHVQCSVTPVWIITAYDPTLNPEEWDEDFKRRRENV